MRLLNTKTFTFKVFYDNVPPYAILSHTWRDDEVLYQDIIGNCARRKHGWSKIRRFCELVSRDWNHMEWVWVDTCCIDKANLSEVQESINSMYRYYSRAELCIAWIDDVEPGTRASDAAFSAARWWSRGWTLQELLAPKNLSFYSAQGNEYIGTRSGNCQIISSITGIPENILTGMASVKTESVGRRLSWAARRTCTKDEDLTYCLFGLLEVSIPVLYGEGLQSAFRRLQEEVIRTRRDESIFVWAGTGPVESLFAPSPAYFESCSQYTNMKYTGAPNTYRLVNGGLKATRKLLCLKDLNYTRYFFPLQVVDVGDGDVVFGEFFGESFGEFPEVLCKEVVYQKYSGTPMPKTLSSVYFLDNKLHRVLDIEALGATFSSSPYKLLVEEGVPFDSDGGAMWYLSQLEAELVDYKP